MIATASLLLAALLLAGWLYWLTDRVQRLLDHAEQLQDAGRRLLAVVPSKSAPRTDGADERRFLGVRMTPDRPVPTPRTDSTPAVVDVGLHRISAADQPRRRHAAPTTRKEHRP